MLPDVDKQPDFRFGEWVHPPQTEPGVHGMGGYSPSDTALSFIRAADEYGWVRPFDWGQWMGTDEAIGLRDDPAALAVATPDQLARLLTTLIRQDRFVEDALGNAYESGLLTAVLRRAAALVGEL